MNLFMLANALDAEPFAQPGEVIAEAAGTQALSLLRELVQLSAPGSFDRNPIRTWQLLADSDAVAYCPFAYGYSNYSRAGYASNILCAGGLVSPQLASRSARHLGGAGLAISRNLQASGRCPRLCRIRRQPTHAEDSYALNPAANQAIVQRGSDSSHLVDAATNNFFANTLSTLDAAWIRPRFPGFIGFRMPASTIVHHYLVHGGAESQVRLTR